MDVPHKKVKLLQVSHRPSGQSFTFGLADLGKLSDDTAASVSFFKKPDSILLLECDNGATVTHWPVYHNEHI